MESLRWLALSEIGGKEMRVLVLVWLLTGIAGIALCDGLTVGSNDIEFRFPDAARPDDLWVSMVPKTVNYWGAAEVPGVHNTKAKLGDQTWRGWLQEDDHTQGGVEFIITTLSLPKTNAGVPARRMELRFRVRDIVNGVLRAISEWSVPNYIDIIGKPGQPVHGG